jgi:hypothetical protein
MNPTIVWLVAASLIAQAKDDFTSKSAGFSVSFPGVPTESFRTEKTVTGPRIHKIFEFAEPGKSRRVICADLSKERLPKLRQEAIDGIIDLYTKSWSGKVLAQKKRTFQGEPAIEVDLEQENGIIHGIYLIKNKRLYQITLYFDNRNNDDPAEFRQFVDSFKAIPPVGNLTDGMDNLTTWKMFHSESGHYRIKVIGEPPERSMSRETPAGAVDVKMIRFLGPKGENYGVFVNPIEKTDPPQAAEAIYETILNGAAEQLKGKIESKKPIDSQARPGLEAVIALPTRIPFADGVYKVRLFRIGDKVYQVIFVGPREKLDTKEIIDFFDSFRVDDDTFKDTPIAK